MEKFIFERSAMAEDMQIQHMEKQQVIALKMAQSAYKFYLRKTTNHAAVERRAVAIYRDHMILHTKFSENLKKKYMAIAYRTGKMLYKQHVAEMIRAYGMLRTTTASKR